MDIFTGLFDAEPLMGQELSEDSLKLFIETIRDRFIEKLTTGEEVFVFNAESPLEQVVVTSIDSVIGFGVFGDKIFTGEDSDIYSSSFDDVAGVLAVGIGVELPPGFGGLPPGFGDSSEFDFRDQIDDLIAQAGISLASGFMIPIEVDFSNLSGNLIAVVGGGLPPGFASPV